MTEDEFIDYSAKEMADQPIITEFIQTVFRDAECASRQLFFMKGENWTKQLTEVLDKRHRQISKL